MSSSQPEKNPEKKKSSNTYLRFSGIGIQMGLLITVGAYGGSYLDEYLQNKKPVFTIIFSLLAIGISLYLIIKEAIRISNEE